MSTRIEPRGSAAVSAVDASIPAADRKAFEETAQRIDRGPGPADQNQPGKPDWWADLPERERNESPKDRTFGVLTNFMGFMPHFRAAALATQRGEGSFLWNLVNTGTPRHEAERKALQQYYNRNYENAQDWVKVVSVAGLPGGPQVQVLKAVTSAKRPVLSGMAAGGFMSGVSGYFGPVEPATGDYWARLQSAAEAIPYGLAIGTFAGAGAHGTRGMQGYLNYRAARAGVRNQLELKNAKAVARGGQPPYADLDTAIQERLAGWKKVGEQGFPNGFGDRAAFDAFKQKLVSELKKFGAPADDIGVHGSAVNKANPKDIDVAIRVGQAQFNKLVRKALVFRPGSAAKIKSQANKGIMISYFLPPVNGVTFPSAIHGAAGEMALQAAFILKGGSFDIGPYLKF
jgi:hypothetical protein